MPIYEQSYRRWEARASLRRWRSWPITREALRLLVSRRLFWALVVLAWMPLLGWIGRIYLGANVPQASRWVSLDSGVFGQFLIGQFLPMLILTIFAGAGLVANDLRTGAILIYLSRPLTRRDYVLGKLGVLVIVNLGITLVPGLLLYATGLGLAADRFARWDAAWILPALLVQSFVVSLVMSAVGLAVSSLSKSARIAGLGLFALVVGLEIVRELLGFILRSPAAGLVSLQDNLQTLARALFGIVSRRPEPHWLLAALALTVVCAACLAVLRARVRAVEIVR